MTFYWWSHWFWITLLANVIFPLTLVHTYPSQDAALEYNQNANPQQKSITRLFQTTSSLSWVTEAPTLLRAVEDFNVTPQMERNKEEADEDDDADEEAEEPLDDVEMKEETNDNDENQNGKTLITDVDNEESVENTEDNDEEVHDFEFKRSAESFNKSSEAEQLKSKDETSAELRANSLKNYTNFSANAEPERSPNRNNNSPPIMTLTKSHQSSSSATVPSTPKIQSPNAAPDWISAMARITTSDGSLPPTASSSPSSSSSSLAGGNAAPNDLEESESIIDEGHKVPFTLENVNKEDELRRAENEHRSRKSKVLSAEYKYVNRYINYSDSKSLLTRSASTAPNEKFNNDIAGDEGNISSEALAIQRTYFLDAGAISAICFTVFGVCCTVGTLGIVLYRRRYLNKPQALSEPDSSVYIDDSTIRVSDNSDEMYSLDNDSFLNSLEAMTIQNYWTDTVKHTKL